MVVSVLGPQFANQLGWFSAEVGRQPWIVYGLLQAGLVELIRPEGAPPVPPSQTQSRTTQFAPQPSADEQKSLINRLITRIRSM